MNFKIALNKLLFRSKPRGVNVAISFQIHFNQSESILKYHPDVINSFQKFQSRFLKLFADSRVAHTADGLCF